MFLSLPFEKELVEKRPWLSLLRLIFKKAFG